MSVPWLNTLTDVRALGIQLGPGHERTMAAGGEILVLQEVPSPGCYELFGDYMPAYDMDQNLVFVASIVDTIPTVDLSPDETQELSLINSELGNEWCYWPSYVGRFDEDNSGAPGRWAMDEQIHVWRIWSAIPVSVIGRDTALAVVEASRRRMDLSYWDQAERYACLLEEVGMPLALRQQLEIDLTESERELLEIQNEMIQAGIWEEGEEGDGQMLPYESMESLLAGNPRAQLVWQKLLYLSRQATLRAVASIPVELRGMYIYQEKEYDPWL